MMRYFLNAFLLLQFLCSQAQLKLADIPDSLRNGMNEVILSDHTSFTINSLTSATLTRSYEVAILNSFARDREQIYLGYDKFRSIKNAKVVLYDQFGTKIETYNLRDFGDFSEKSFSMASDSRSKYLKITHKKYPFILSVEYTMDYLTSYIFPSWAPQSDEKQSVMHASFELINKLEYPIRYKEINIKADSIIEKPKDSRYYWSAHGLSGYTYEPFSKYIDRSPRVYPAPTKFEFDGYQGDMSTWQDFGKWSWELNKNRNTLTYEQLKPIRAEVAPAKSKLDSIRLVYDYVQKNTHYVSIQLGIGGMQPFESGFVHEQKYGDCKALSFYTQCLLEAIGIKSHYTLIYGGKSPMELFPDFPDDYFNHIILTVPLEKDTIWLECTSQTNSFGNLGTFTGNRYGLLIAEDGGHLIRTKHYDKDQNIQSTRAKIFLEPDGRGIAEISRKYQGMEIENDGFNWIMLEPESKQRDWFIDKHHWGSVKLNELSMKEITDEPNPTGGFIAVVELEKLAKPSGDRLFYNPFIFTNSSGMNLPNKERKHPIHLRYPYVEIDSLEIILPTSYYPEREIKDETIETRFGKYSRQVIKKEDTYLFIRRFEFESGEYPASDYEEFRSFIKSVQKNDNEKLVLINKT